MLYVLLSSSAQSASCLSQAELGTAADFLESYELVAFDVADPEGGANDIVAGAVHGGDTVLQHLLGVSGTACLLQPRHAAAASLTAATCMGRCSHARHCKPKTATSMCKDKSVGAGRAVRAGFCGRCFRDGLPSLCHHKSPAHAAALCTFDARAGPAATQRFGIHHRRCKDPPAHTMGTPRRHTERGQSSSRMWPLGASWTDQACRHTAASLHPWTQS
jgi:hypothetical protein